MRNYRLISGAIMAMSMVFDISTPTSDVHTTVVTIILLMNPGGASTGRMLLMKEISPRGRARVCRAGTQFACPFIPKFHILPYRNISGVVEAFRM